MQQFHTVNKTISTISHLLLSTALLVSASMPTAFAAPTAQEVARAEALFKEGRRLMDEKKYSEACPKFEESIRLEEAAGSILNLAVCYLEMGKTASAWVQFESVRVLSARDRNTDRVRIATNYLTSLTPKLSKLTIVVPEKADVPGLEVSLDGSLFGRASWNMAFPTDPGTHVLSATALGKKAWSTTIKLGDVADLQKIEIPVLEDLPKPKPMPEPKKEVPAALQTSLIPVQSRITPEVIPPRSNPNMRIAAYVTGGVGLAAIGVSIWMGLRVPTLKSESNSLVNQDEAEARRKMDQARTFLIGSRITTGVGIVGLGVGTALFFMSNPWSSNPKPAHEKSRATWYGAPYASADGAGLMMGGSF